MNPFRTSFKQAVNQLATYFVKRTQNFGVSDSGDINYAGDIKPSRSSTSYTGSVFVPLTTPYTNTSFDGDSFSDVSSNTKIENTSWSTTIPASATAVLLKVQVRDSGSAGTSGLYFAVNGSSSVSTFTVLADPSGKDNDDWIYETAVCPCNNGDLWYRCNASGAGTMEVYLEIWGYWI
jgi:hypothetical protein